MCATVECNSECTYTVYMTLTHMDLRCTVVGNGVKIQYCYPRKISIQSPKDRHRRTMVRAKHDDKT
jgi:hypothetical protein